MDGDFNVRKWKGPDALLNQRVMRIKNWRAELAAAFLAIPLQMILDHLHTTTSQTTVKHLSAKQANGIYLPLPPLAEQHRIVAKVDELMVLCDRLAAAQAERESARPAGSSVPNRTEQRHGCRVLREHARVPPPPPLPRLTTRREHIQRLRQTISSTPRRFVPLLVPKTQSDDRAEAIYSGASHQARLSHAEKKIPKPGPTPRVEDLGIPSAISMGVEMDVAPECSATRFRRATFFAGAMFHEMRRVPFLSTRNVKLGGFDLSDLKYVSKKDHKEFCKRIRPEKGDILYTKGGTTGIARVNDLDFEFSVWVHLAVLRIAKEFLEPRYIELALNSPLCYEQSQAYTQGISNYDLGLTRID